MVRLFPTMAFDHHLHHFGSVTLAIGLFISVSALVALCAKHAIRRSSKKPESSKLSNQKPRVKTASDKGGSLVKYCEKTNVSEVADHHQQYCDKEIFDEFEIGEKEVVGEDELWQRAIIMGDKCQPPEFSGGIYYDYDGNRIAELPSKSPKARVSFVANY